MTALASTESTTWAWWEARRLRYNLGLFVAGWVGFGIQCLAFAYLRSFSVGVDLGIAVLGQGLVYLLYMAGANVLYLAGPLLEGVLRPDPVGPYRTSAWRLGFWASAGLPVMVATVISLILVWPFITAPI